MALWRAEPEPAAVMPVLFALHSGMVFLCLGNRFVTAARLLERIDELAGALPGDGSDHRRARPHVPRSIVDALGSGDPERALHRAVSARECYRRSGDATYLAWAQLFLCIALLGSSAPSTGCGARWRPSVAPEPRAQLAALHARHLRGAWR